jgi:hypothetical protein
VLEANLSAWLARVLGSPVWDRTSIIQSAAQWDQNDKRRFVTPARLSPEQISEFPLSADRGQVCAVVGERARSEALAVTVYLHDLLVATTDVDRSEPESFQAVQDHCRYVFPFAIDSLENMTDRIQQFVNDTKRTT